MADMTTDRTDDHDPLEIAYTDTLIEQATQSFFRDFFSTTYGRVLMLACVVNVAGFVLIVAMGVRDRFMLFVIGMIAALGPLYLSIVYFYFPQKFSDVLKQRLQPAAKISLSSAGFGIAANGRAVTLPWSDVKRIREFPDYFILLTSRFAFTIIPKQGLPAASQQLLRQISTRHGQTTRK